MDRDNNDEWLRDIVRPVREVDRVHTPSFERVWRAVERRSMRKTPPWMGAPKLAWGVAAVLTAGALVSWNSAEAPNHYATERDLAGLDSVLVTYWEAPSDALLEPLAGDPVERVQ